MCPSWGASDGWSSSSRGRLSRPGRRKALVTGLYVRTSCPDAPPPPRFMDRACPTTTRPPMTPSGVVAVIRHILPAQPLPVKPVWQRRPWTRTFVLRSDVPRGTAEVRRSRKRSTWNIHRHKSESRSTWNIASTAGRSYSTWNRPGPKQGWVTRGTHAQDAGPEPGGIARQEAPIRSDATAVSA
jgi:hypothetical protein